MRRLLIDVLVALTLGSGVAFAASGGAWVVNGVPQGGGSSGGGGDPTLRPIFYSFAPDSGRNLRFSEGTRDVHFVKAEMCWQ